MHTWDGNMYLNYDTNNLANCPFSAEWIGLQADISDIIKIGCD